MFEAYFFLSCSAEKAEANAAKQAGKGGKYPGGSQDDGCVSTSLRQPLFRVALWISCKEILTMT